MDRPGMPTAVDSDRGLLPAPDTDPFSRQLLAAMLAFRNGGHNVSWNCGVEGPTADPAIRALRARQQRNFMATLFVSQGVPMIAGGDELGRTQQGNNNAYCQDNEISWTDWTLTDERRALLAFCRRASRLMRSYAVLRRRRFFEGRILPVRGADVKDIMWLAPSGQEMTEAEWNANQAGCVGIRLSGDAIGEVDEDGMPIMGDTILYLMNACRDQVSFTLPSFEVCPRWQTILDTYDDRRVEAIHAGGVSYPLAAHSLAVFVLHQEGRKQRL